MWEADLPSAGDPLRQGDLLDEVMFPIMKPPLQTVSIGEPLMVVKAKVARGVVVSQCCDNVDGQYAVIAQVQTFSSRAVTSQHLKALHTREPPQGDGSVDFVVTEFLVDPVLGLLDPPDLHRVLLTRTVTVWGDACADYRSLRRARMTPEGRRHLRLNLQELWGRVEEEDHDVLFSRGIPDYF